MNELQLKYGMNPNQKPARIFMKDGSDLPVKVLQGRPGYINCSWCASSRARPACRPPLPSST